MSERLSLPIQNEIDRILQKKFGVEQTSQERIVGESSHTVYVSREIFQRWAGMLGKVRDLPASEFQDDVVELRREVDVLHLSVESIRQAWETTKKTLEELSREINDIRSIIQTSNATITGLCRAYVEAVSNIDLVRQVLLSQDEEVATLWTIIDAPPFEDSFRIPIYEAQTRLLRSIREDILVDFCVLNVSELSDNQRLKDIISPDFTILWQR